MKRISRLVLLTFIAQIFSIVILITVSIFRGFRVEIRDALYATIISVGQMFLPFLLYVFISTLIEKKIAHVKGIRNRNGIHFFVYLGLMIFITVTWSIGDIFLSGMPVSFYNYIDEFSFFIVFSLIVSGLTYLYCRE